MEGWIWAKGMGSKRKKQNAINCLKVNTYLTNLYLQGLESCIKKNPKYVAKEMKTVCESDGYVVNGFKQSRLIHFFPQSWFTAVAKNKTIGSWQQRSG